MQVENEYGAYGSDKDYLRALAKLLRGIGVTVPLTTVDQPIGSMLADGSLPELHATGSFGSHVAERLAALRRHQRHRAADVLGVLGRVVRLLGRAPSRDVRARTRRANWTRCCAPGRR